MKLSEVNKNIARIRDNLVPVTNKSIAEPYMRIIFDTKHSRAGEIMSFKEVKERELNKGISKPLSEYMYYKIRKELEQEEFFKQTDYETAFSYARKRHESVLADFYEELDDFDKISEIESLSDEEIVLAISNAGNRVNQLKKNKFAEYSFYEFLEEEFEKILKGKS